MKATHGKARLRSVPVVADELIVFIDAISPVRGFLLVGAAFAAWRAATLHRLGGYHSPLPWAGMVFVCIAVLAMLSLSA